MRRAAKVDRNHAEIVRAFRQIGASVQSLASMGGGCPDLLVGWRGQNWLVEVKDGTRIPSERRLNADQKRWHESWAGQVMVAESVEDAISRIAFLTLGGAA